MTRLTRYVSVALMAWLLLQVSLPAQDPEGQAEIRGRVVASGTGAPLAGAAVTVLGSGTRPMAVKTDDDGRFVVTGLAAGTYRVRVSLIGFVTTSYGAATGPDPITLGWRDKLNRGDLVLPRGQAIGGLILDASGKPARGATVRVMRAYYPVPGDRRLSVVGSVDTNASGDYRVSGLVPGTYYVAASPDRITAPTYFPGVDNGNLAVAVTVRAGVDVSGVDIRVIDTPLVRISGVVVNSTGQPAIETFVWLSPARSEGLAGAAPLTSDVDGEGRFLLRDVPPGQYVLEVLSKTRVEAIARTGASAAGMDASETATVPVSVDTEHITGLVVTTGPPVIVSGRVTLDGKPLPDDVAAQMRLQMTVRAMTGSVTDTLKASLGAVNPDGTFAMVATEGGRLLRAMLPPGIFLKQVTVNGIDVTDDGFDLTNDIRNVQVQLSTRTTVVTGRVTSAHGVALPGAAVIVYATDARRWTTAFTRVVKGGRTAADGQFTFVDLPPGSYLAIAQAELEDGEWASPANLNRLRVRAKAFTIGEGERISVTLVLQ